MTNKVAVTYDGQVIYPDEHLKLGTHTTPVQVQVGKMKLTLRKKKTLLNTEDSQTPQEYVHLSDSLDHYLFW